MATPQQTRRRKTVRERTKYVLREDKRYRMAFRTLFTVLLIFVGVLSFALMNVYISEIRAQIGERRALLQSLREDNAALRAEFVQRYSLDDLEWLARERLGMHPPDPSQIIYIHVPKQSYVVLGDEPEKPKATGINWENILNFFKNIITIKAAQ